MTEDPSGEVRQYYTGRGIMVRKHLFGSAIRPRFSRLIPPCLGYAVKEIDSLYPDWEGVKTVPIIIFFIIMIWIFDEPNYD